MDLLCNNDKLIFNSGAGEIDSNFLGIFRRYKFILCSL